MKKNLTFLVLAFTLLNAQTTDELLNKAKELEKKGEYKEAMKLYKIVALEQTKTNRLYIDERRVKAQKVTSNILNKIEDKETENTIKQIIASNFNLYPYKENYLLPLSYDIKKKENREQNEVKFQVSLKKPIFYNLFKMKETINFGYTQTSWWQLYKQSAPFRETNYKPEIFMEIPYGKKDKTVLKGFKLGVLHESNGQNEENSRSWNRVYLTNFLQAGNLFIIPRIWHRLKEDEKNDDNPDIEKYLGYGDLTLAYAYKQHTFKLLLRNNLRKSDDNKGYAQLNWTLPFFNSKNYFGYIQASTGYGDSLIDYDRRVDRLGIGISLSR